jgi:hypothetical protein
MIDSLVFCRLVSCLLAAFAGMALSVAHAGQQPTARDVPLAIAEDAIEGVIRDVDGAPLAGVTVGLRRAPLMVVPASRSSGNVLFPRVRGVDSADTLDERLERIRREWRPTLEEALAAAEAAWDAERLDIRSTTTDANGVFVFEGLRQDGVYELDCALEGYRLSPSGGVRALRGQRMDFAAQKLHSVEFEFVGESGEVFDEVLVRQGSGAWGGLGVQWQRVSSSLMLGPEPATLQFAAGGFRDVYEPVGEYTSEVITIDPGDPAHSAGPVRVVLRRRVWLDVRLEDPWSAGGGSGERWLVAKKLADDEVFDAAAYAAVLAAARPLHRREYSTTWGAVRELEPVIGLVHRAYGSPRFVFDDLARGRYVVGVCDSSATLLAWSEVALEQPGTVVTLRPTQPDSTGRLVVKLANAHRDRLGARPRFVVDAMVDGRWQAVENDVLTSPTGEHWIGLAAVPPGASELRVGAIHETLGLAYEVIAPDVRELELVFPRSSTLELALEGLHPSVLATNIRAELEFQGPHLEGAGPKDRHSAHLVLDGEHLRNGFGPDLTSTVGGLSPGVWRVSVSYVAGLRTIEFDAGEVLLEPGETTLRVVTVPKIVDVEVETAVGYAGQPLALMALDSDVELARAFVDAQGIARFGLLPVGRARLGFFNGPSVDESTLTEIVIDESRIEWRTQ